MNLNETILALRREAVYTQERLAEMLGVSTAAVSKWETDSSYPDITLLPKLAEVFECSVDYLLGYDVTARTNGGAGDCVCLQIDARRAEFRRAQPIRSHKGQRAISESYRKTD